MGDVISINRFEDLETIENEKDLVEFVEAFYLILVLTLMLKIH